MTEAKRKGRTVAGVDTPAIKPSTQGNVFEQLHAQGWNIEHSRVYRDSKVVERIHISERDEDGSAIWLDGEGADFDEAFLAVAAQIERAMGRLVSIGSAFAGIINAAVAANERT